MAERNNEPAPWQEIAVRTARTIADWPDPEAEVTSAIEEAIANPRRRTIRRNRPNVT